MFPKGGFRGFFSSSSLSVGVYFVRWGAFLELFFSRESQTNAELFYNKPSVIFMVLLRSAAGGEKMRREGNLQKEKQS
jgi:hypothetical protein